MAWTAFGAQDYSGLERHGRDIYNYFVHNPSEILKLDNPLLIGKIIAFSSQKYRIPKIRN